MAWKDELSNAKRVFKNGTSKQKVEFIFDYYKWHIVAALIISIFLGYFIYFQSIKKDCVLQGIILNSPAQPEVITELEKDYLSHSPIDLSSEEMFLDSMIYYSGEGENEVFLNTYETAQVLVSQIAAGELDFVIGDLSTLNEFIYGEYCYSLTEILSKEQIDRYSPYFLYCDRAVLKQLANMDFLTEKISNIDFPDATKPELMEDPIPVMLNISSSEKIESLYPNSDKIRSIAFTVNSNNTENVLSFLDYLLS